jgi:hypothetical protein
MARHGRVVGDRYHARILKTPSEVRNARGHLRDNARKHYGAVGRDPYVSDAPVVAPRTWLLSGGDARLRGPTHRPHAPDPING